MTLLAALWLAVVQALSLAAHRHDAGAAVRAGGVCAVVAQRAADPGSDGLASGAHRRWHLAPACDDTPAALHATAPVLRAVLRGGAAPGSSLPHRPAALHAPALPGVDTAVLARRRATTLWQSHAASARGGHLSYYPTAPPSRV